MVENVIVVAAVALMGAGECEAKTLGVMNGCDIKMILMICLRRDERK